jgi:hypothetical protein
VAESVIFRQVPPSRYNLCQKWDQWRNTSQYYMPHQRLYLMTCTVRWDLWDAGISRMMKSVIPTAGLCRNGRGGGLSASWMFRRTVSSIYPPFSDCMFFAWSVWEKLRNRSVSITGFRAEFWTLHLPNSTQEFQLQERDFCRDDMQFNLYKFFMQYLCLISVHFYNCDIKPEDSVSVRVQTKCVVISSWTVQLIEESL